MGYYMQSALTIQTGQFIYYIQVLLAFLHHLFSILLAFWHFIAGIITATIKAVGRWEDTNPTVRRTVQTTWGVNRG